MAANHAQALFRIKCLHTFAWAVFAGAIILIPLATLSSRFSTALWLSMLVWLEVGVLAANRWRCPLTDLAARHTIDRQDNFDIFLPLWLARWNKTIFGTLFVLAQLHLWWRWPPGHPMLSAL